MSMSQQFTCTVCRETPLICCHPVTLDRDACHLHLFCEPCLVRSLQRDARCPTCRGTAVGLRLLSDASDVVRPLPLGNLSQQTDTTVNHEDTPCDMCGLLLPSEDIMLCDSCDHGFHYYCLGLFGVPSGSWVCTECRLIELIE